MNLENELERLLPKQKAIASAIDLLNRCEWKMELGESNFLTIPHNVIIDIRSRAFIKADKSDVFCGDHLEATVLIGAENVGQDICARYCVLKLYFNIEGQFISEDLYPSEIHDDD